MGIQLFHSLACVALLLTGCATSTPIQRFSESKSHFSNPPELIRHNFPDKDIYRIYHRASTGFDSIQSIRQSAEERAEQFARRQGKSFATLGEKISQPPYILGNFPRIEIVFALIDEPGQGTPDSAGGDKYDQLDRLKKLLDEKVITQEEFDREKGKILQGH